MEYKTAETNQDGEIKERGDAAANFNISSSASGQLCCLLRVLEKKKKEREREVEKFKRKEKCAEQCYSQQGLQLPEVSSSGKQGANM